MDLMKSAIVRQLPYHRKLIAQQLVDRGADLALLYFWFNLINANYASFFKLADVEKEAVHFMKRNPDFEDEILQWFQTYETLVYPNGNHIRTPIHHPTHSPGQEQQGDRPET